MNLVTEFCYKKDLQEVRVAGKQITLVDDQEWPAAGFSFELPIRPEACALGVIDVQHYALDSDGDLAHTLRQSSTGVLQEFSRQAERMVSNIQKLLSTFREQDRRVVYTRHGAFLPDGPDLIIRRRGREEVALTSGDCSSGHMAVRGTPGHEILAQVRPRRGELVLDKNTSSAFHSSPMDLLLRNMKVETLVLTGLATDQCVLATAIDAADRGFHVILAADACAGFDAGSSEAVQILFGRVWGYVMQTDDIIYWLRTGDKPTRTRLPA